MKRAVVKIIMNYAYVYCVFKRRLNMVLWRRTDGQDNVAAAWTRRSDLNPHQLSPKLQCSSSQKLSSWTNGLAKQSGCSQRHLLPVPDARFGRLEILAEIPLRRMSQTCQMALQPNSKYAPSIVFYFVMFHSQNQRKSYWYYFKLLPLVWDPFIAVHRMETAIHVQSTQKSAKTLLSLEW